MCNCISNRPWHCKTRTIYIFDPYSLRSTKSSSVILGLQHFASSRTYPLFLVWHFRFVIRRQLFVFYFFSSIWIIARNKNDSGITSVRSKKLVAREESWSQSWPTQLHVECSIIFKIVLTLDNSIVQRISNDLLFLLLNYLRSFFLFFWIRFRLHLLLLLLTNFYEFGNIICKFHLDQQAALSSILSVTIAYREKMLMESLTHVRS